MLPSDNYDTLHARLNRETARLGWAELQPHFAGGSMVAVDPSLDLVDVAVRIAEDDSAAIKEWLDAGLLAKVSDAQAGAWAQQAPMLWTVIVKPWILVQPDAPVAH
jgi:hypothetical protein